MNIAAVVRTYIRDNFLFGSDAQLNNSASLLEAGVIDSTGAMELVAFLETEFGIVVDDQDLVPENLDSIDAITSFVSRRLAEVERQPGAPLAATS